ncbi:MAG TPA: DegT/DnrJ/EryC1/StrS family aminotransferase, partial [Anaerolineales bacterium]|nr:DegT/DnrJ/EryC1/StrS family aminotransferase [Anaerolineales bacterium]
MPGPGMELIGQEEIDEVLDLLQKGYLLRYGKPDNPAFSAKAYKLERKVAKRCRVPYAIGVNSGTSALLTALLGLGIGPGDEVIVPGYTFVASISTIIYAGAVPVLAEVDGTLNLDPGDVREKITARTKAIMVVHMLGNPAKMDELLTIAKTHNLFVVEDCAQTFGGSYQGKPLGSLGDVGCFSFNGFKTITAGEGGMLITKDEALYRRCFAIHDQGHHPHRTGVEVGARAIIGLDFRLTELQAAVLLGQLKKLDAMLAHMRANKALYKSLIADLPGINFRELPDPPGDIGTLLVVFFKDEGTARKVAAELGSKVVADSGWHVYNNMEHILEYRTVTERHNPVLSPAYTSAGGEGYLEKGMLPQTDAL